MRVGVFLLDVMSVVRGDQRNPHALRQIDCALGTLALDIETAVLDLEVIVFAEGLLEPGDDLVGLSLPFSQEMMRQLPRRAAGQADQPLAMLLQHLAADARLVVKAVQKADRRELDQVLEAGLVLGQQRQMMRRFARSADDVRHPSGGRVGLIAQDRIDPRVTALGVKLQRPVQVAVIRDRQRGHPQLFDPLDELRDLARPVEQTVMRVAMEVGERPRRVGHRAAIHAGVERASVVLAELYRPPPPLGESPAGYSRAGRRGAGRSSGEGRRKNHRFHGWHGFHG